MEILLIDPSKSYRQVVKQLLKSEEVKVVEAETGQEGLGYLTSQRPDAICVAYELCDMDSFKFLKKINKNAFLSNIPKFLVTSNASQDFKRTAYDAGFTEIFLKSDFQTLKRAMHSLLMSVTTSIQARVLYVEDAQSTANYTMHIMHSVGWNITHVKSGAEAAEYLDKPEYSFDLLVTDLVLEGPISGIGLIDLIRHGDERIRNIPILAVSGWNDLLRQVYVLRHGAGDFIAKPFHENDFLARAINLIMHKRELKAFKEQQKALYLQANIDKASGLNNRNFMESRGRAFIEDAIAENIGAAIIVLDIDHFKQINDQHGHQAGDAVIKHVSNVVKGMCHVDDLEIRYGGDEIVILMTDYEEAEIIERAESLREEVETLKPEGMAITASVGAAYLPKHEEPQMMEMLNNLQNMPAFEESLDFKTLFKVADEALYTVKQGGRNGIKVVNAYEWLELSQ